MSFRPIYEGWDLPGRVSRSIRSTFFGFGLSRDVRAAAAETERLVSLLRDMELADRGGRQDFATNIATRAIANFADDADTAFADHLAAIVVNLIDYEGWFALPDFAALPKLQRSELWQIEDQIKRVSAILGNLEDVEGLTVELISAMIAPVIAAHPRLLSSATAEFGSIRFDANLLDLLSDLPAVVEDVLQLPFAPEFEPLVLLPRTRDRLEYNLAVVTGVPPGADTIRAPKMPTKQKDMPPARIPEAYLAGTPFRPLFDFPLSIDLPTETRFSHHHIVAGSGHGKTQTLQHLILRDLESVATGDASIVVMDSQSDLINTIAGLDVFAPGGPLADRLVHIDPTDIEWPVALNLFDVGQDRLEGYTPLARERLTNSILELYDFVLGSLLEAGMTQKQTVIFRYITRLLLRIPGATIHTLRELLEDGGFQKYEGHIKALTGSARAFFENEFQGKEFTATKRQVLRRLYGILENQTFERMFSHPKSKLDLFIEMNAGKVILINTAKNLLKESGAEIFGRFFIALIAQAAQERAVLKPDDRLPIFVYIDEANDYFDQNIGVILSQARKYRVGMVLAHQYLGQLDAKLAEAIATNTAIKFAGGVSAKDARALSGDLRTEAEFIERQPKLSFAAFIKGETERAVSIAIKPGQMETLPRMTDTERQAVREEMRRRYAVHYADLDYSIENMDSSEMKNSQSNSNIPPHISEEPQVW